MRTLVWTMLLAASAVWGQGNGAQTTCSNATLDGDFGFIITGTRLSHPGGPMESVVGVAMTHFDGSGNLTQTDNIHGSVSGFAAPDRKGTGTYTINADCTGTMTLVNEGTPPLTLRIVVVDNANEVRTAVVSPLMALVTSVGRRVAPVSTSK